MRRVTYLVMAAALGAATSVVAIAGPAAAADNPLVSAGSVRLSGIVATTGPDRIGDPEFPVAREGHDEGEGGEPPATSGPAVRSARVAAAGREVSVTFPGIDHRDQRLASNGNQFSLEPPDQALCVGPGHVVESVNTALRVYDKAGNAVTPTIGLNEFFGYTPGINRVTGEFGAFVTDPICHFDPDTGRYFLAILTIDQDPGTGNFTGKNRLDIAVSRTSDPTGDWKLYKLPVQNDGTEGTPDHDCDPIDPADAGPEVTSPGACIGDYPHIGADRNGIYLTTNEYSLFSDGSNGGAAYTGAQIYAISKRQLVAGVDKPAMQMFESPKLGPFRSFTVWPAIAPKGQDSRANGGTEFFLSSTLGDGSETGNTAPSEKRIGVWSLTNTRSLDSATPNLRLASSLVPAARYALPPESVQKPGPTPLADCLNDRGDTFGPGVGCWGLFFDTAPTTTEELSGLDSGDTRMQQVLYADGELWGALGTAVQVGGQTRAGILWVRVEAEVEKGRLRARTDETGYVAVAGHDVSYPALARTRSGKVVMAATLVGTDHYPSATYTVLNSGRPTVKVISEGVGPKDGFSGYEAFGGGRARWGDYGAAAMDGDRLWLASETIEQSCTLTEYLTGGIGSCGGTRTSLANWATRVSAVTL